MKESGRWQRSRLCVHWSWQGDSDWLHAFPEEHHLLCLHFYSETDLHGNVRLLVDLCRLRDIMRDKLGTMPPPAVEPEAWERLWKAYPRSWKQLLRAFVSKEWQKAQTEQHCYNARSDMHVALSTCPDLEFLCPSCPAEARTWPNRAALRSHMMAKTWVEEPMATICRRIVLP